MAGSPTGYKIKMANIPTESAVYDSSQTYIDVGNALCLYSTSILKKDMSSVFQSGSSLGGSFHFNRKLSSDDAWVLTPTFVPYRYSSGSFTSDFILRGSFPNFNTMFHSISSSEIFDIERTSGGITIGTTTYRASSFKDGVVPSSIIVAVQAPGAGGGGGSLGSLYHGGGGGGGCFAIAILKFDSSHKSFAIDAELSGGSGGNVGGAGGSGGDISISCSGSTMSVSGGSGGSSRGGSGGSYTVTGSNIVMLGYSNGGSGKINSAGEDVSSCSFFATKSSSAESIASSFSDMKLETESHSGGAIGYEPSTLSYPGGGGASSYGNGGHGSDSFDAGQNGRGYGAGGGGGVYSSYMGGLATKGGSGSNGFIKFYY